MFNSTYSNGVSVKVHMEEVLWCTAIGWNTHETPKVTILLYFLLTLIWCCLASSMVLRAQQWASCRRCSLLWCSLCISANTTHQQRRKHGSSEADVFPFGLMRQMTWPSPPTVAWGTLLNRMWQDMVHLMAWIMFFFKFYFLNVYVLETPSGSISYKQLAVAVSA